MRRLGRFVLTRPSVEDYPGLRRLLQERVIIEQLERDWATDNLEYIASGEAFEEVEPGANVPAYMVLVHLGHEEGDVYREVPFEIEFEPAKPGDPPMTWIRND